MEKSEFKIKIDKYLNSRIKKCYEIILSNEEKNCVNDSKYLNKFICDKLRLISNYYIKK